MSHVIFINRKFKRSYSNMKYHQIACSCLNCGILFVITSQNKNKTEYHCKKCKNIIEDLGKAIIETGDGHERNYTR